MSRWLVNNTIIKIAVLVLIVKEVWLLLGIPSVSNALIAFCTVGAIPGTDKSLSPGATFAVLAAVLVFAAVLIFRTELVRLFTDQKVLKQYAADMPIAKPVAKPAAKQIAAAPAWQRVAAARLRPAFSRVLVVTWQALWVMQRALVVTGLFIAAKSVQAWHWAEPYARRFDHWLDVRLHHYKPTAKALTYGGSIAKLLSPWVVKAKAAYAETLAAIRQSHKTDPEL